MSTSEATFCIFAHVFYTYVAKGIVPFLDNADDATMQCFLSIQSKPDEEAPEIRLDHILADIRKNNRKVVFCVDAASRLASSAVQYCHTVGIPFGLIVKVNGGLGFWAELHKQAPFTFVLGIGPTDQLPKLFPGAATQYDRSNRLTAPTHAKDFVLRQVEELEMR